jgi:hypothetical protein
MTDLNAAATEAPAPTEEEAMAAVWDKMAANGIEPEPEVEPAQEADQAPEPVADAAPEAKPEHAPVPVDVPHDLPKGIRDKWAEMPEAARDAVLSSHRELGRKLADQGRVVQAAKPVFDVLVEASQQIPSLANMTPAQIATDVFKMAQIQGQLAQDPVRTILGIAQQYGAVDGIRQALGNQAPDAAAQQNIALVQEVRQLRAMLQQNADPSALEQRVMQTLTIRDTERMVSEYAAQKDYWGDVEPVIPQMIPIAQQRLGPSASAKDVLDAAYDMAIHAIPDLRAKLNTAAAAPAQPIPDRTAAQMKAKSVNVKSTPTAPRAQSDEEAMAAVWERYRK